MTGNGAERVGRVEVICGPMFAGKTEELMRRVRRARIAGRRVELINHALDTRRGPGQVSSHSGLSVPSRMVGSVEELERVVAELDSLSTADPSEPDGRAALSEPDGRAAPGGPGGLEIVAIDEAHFFGVALLGAVMRIADRGLTVLVAGLDVTFDAGPFEPIPSIAALAESVDKYTAVCTVCGRDAAFHEKVRGADVGPEQVDARATKPEYVGGVESYQARCRAHLSTARWRADRAD